MVTGMLDDALPAFATNSDLSLNALPIRARDEIKRYFHGKYLNVEGFVSLICSHPFSERLSRCRTLAEKDACLCQAFCARVATDAEILFQIKTIASEIGAEIDDYWTTCCTDLSRKWNVRMKDIGESFAADENANRLDVLIRAELQHAARLATSDSQRPAIGDTIDKIGQSALLLLPLGKVSVTSIGPLIATESNPAILPVFLLLAARHVWDYIMARLDDPRGDMQSAISQHMALMGNRIALEFERDVRRRIVDLHTWQEKSIRTTATQLACERIQLYLGNHEPNHAGNCADSVSGRL